MCGGGGGGGGGGGDDGGGAVVEVAGAIGDRRRRQCNGNAPTLDLRRRKRWTTPLAKVKRGALLLFFFGIALFGRPALSSQHKTKESESSAKVSGE